MRRRASIAPGTSTFWVSSTVGLRFQQAQSSRNLAHDHVRDRSSSRQRAAYQRQQPRCRSTMRELSRTPRRSARRPARRPSTDTLPLDLLDHVDWAITGPWSHDQVPGTTRAPGTEPTPDLHVLLQAIVNDPQLHARQRGGVHHHRAGRHARGRARPSRAVPSQPYLTVEYVPHKATAAVRGVRRPGGRGRPGEGGGGLPGHASRATSATWRSACRLARRLHVHAEGGRMRSSSRRCARDPCDRAGVLAEVAPQNCDPTGIAEATQGDGQPHAGLCGELAAGVAADRAPRAPATWTRRAARCSVQVRDEDGENPHSAGNTARGRDAVRRHAVSRRSPRVFRGHEPPDQRERPAVLGRSSSDHRLTDVTGVGENTGRRLRRQHDRCRAPSRRT